MEELIIEYIEKFDDSPLRIGDTRSEAEIKERLRYCIDNNITIDELDGDLELEEGMLI